jgi:hypothetical protein
MSDMDNATTLAAAAIPPGVSPTMQALLRAFTAGELSRVDFATAVAALTCASHLSTTSESQNLSVHPYLAELLEFQGDVADSRTANRWILGLERDFVALGLDKAEWSLACFQKMPLTSKASLWYERVYRGGLSFSRPVLEGVKGVFLKQFTSVNEHVDAQSAFAALSSSTFDDIPAFNEAFRAVSIRLDFAFRANNMVLGANQLALEYRTKLVGDVGTYVDTVVNLRDVINREQVLGGRQLIPHSLPELMGEAVQMLAIGARRACNYRYWCRRWIWTRFGQSWQRRQRRWRGR